MTPPTEADPLQFRHARLEDLDAIIALEKVAFRLDRFKRRQFRYLIRHALFYVATDGHGIRAYAILLHRKNSTVSRLYGIATDPAFQGRGIGHSFIDFLQKEAQKYGKRTLSLEVREDNQTAIRFYEKTGFQPVGLIPDYYEDHSPAIKMQKRL